MGAIVKAKQQNNIDAKKFMALITVSQADNCWKRKKKKNFGKKNRERKVAFIAFTAIVHAILKVVFAMSAS